MVGQHMVPDYPNVRPLILFTIYGFSRDGVSPCKSLLQPPMTAMTNDPILSIMTPQPAAQQTTKATEHCYCYSPKQSQHLQLNHGVLQEVARGRCCPCSCRCSIYLDHQSTSRRARSYSKTIIVIAKKY